MQNSFKNVNTAIWRLLKYGVSKIDMVFWLSCTTPRLAQQLSTINQYTNDKHTRNLWWHTVCHAILPTRQQLAEWRTKPKSLEETSVFPSPIYSVPNTSCDPTRWPFSHFQSGKFIGHRVLNILWKRYNMAKCMNAIAIASLFNDSRLRFLVCRVCLSTGVVSFFDFYNQKMQIFQKWYDMLKTWCIILGNKVFLYIHLYRDEGEVS